MKPTAEEVREFEKVIDREFEETLEIGGLALAMVRNVTVDILETLLTGHGKVNDAQSASLSAYSHNLVNGVSELLRQARRLCSPGTVIRSIDVDETITSAIASCSLYTSVQDAYVSYSRGYASATDLRGDHLDMDPIGTSFDARLRYFQAENRLADHPPSALVLPNLIDDRNMRRLARSMMRGVLKKNGGYTYWVEQSLTNEFAAAYRDCLFEHLEITEDLDLGNCSLFDLIDGYAVVCAVSFLHKTITSLTMVSEVGKSFNWPSLYRTKSDWRKLLINVRNRDAVLSALTFDDRRPADDICITPLVPLTSQYLAISPTAVLRSNIARNAMVLLTLKYPKQYSSFSSTKEDRLISAFLAAYSSICLAAKLPLPKFEGLQLPDIDLLLYGPEEGTLLVCEIKWQLSGSTTREVINRNEYLKKGGKQLKKIRRFLEQTPGFFHQRGLVPRKTTVKKLHYVLLCKGHMASECVFDAAVTICDYDAFKKGLDEGGVPAAFELASTYSYLPNEGTDFSLQPLSVQFQRKSLRWWLMVPPQLPDDDESEEVEEYYRASRSFMT